MSVLTAPPALGLKQIVESVDDVASLPDVTMRIIQTADDPNSNCFQLLKVVSHDPALVAKILKLVNSSFYGLPNRIASLDRAISLLGMGGIRNLAIASSISGMFRGGELCPGYGPRDLWTHSIAVAVVAREIARKMKLAVSDEAFLVGMLHDLGLLVIHQKLPRQLRTICEESRKQQRSLCEIEREIIGFDHQELGNALASRWKFPASVRDAIAFHHNPAEAPAEHRAVASLICVADTLCCQAGEGFNLTACHQEMDEPLLAAIPAAPQVVTETQNRIKELVASACPFMD